MGALCQGAERVHHRWGPPPLWAVRPSRVPMPHPAGRPRAAPPLAAAPMIDGLLPAEAGA
jgi:hypothetical protein